MTRQTVLVVDDEPSICWAFEKMLSADGHDVLTASSAEEGLRLAAENAIDLIVLDVRLPQEDGITALPKFLKASDNAPVIVMTAFGDLETAVSAVKQGATDYLAKPIGLDDASRACRSALSQAAGGAPPTATKPMQIDHSVLVGTSPAMQQVFRQIALVAESDLSVLITGETGTGKELVAGAIHRHSGRASAPYFPIAPVAFNPELIESEMFGHVKGAFTGAVDDHAGLFERADGGTILLDEIGDLPLGAQVKLLRVLEQGHYTRVGDVTPRRANVRILAATNSDLHDAVNRGDFREDLFHRLAGMQIHLPPLRERIEDIMPLCEFFLSAMQYGDTKTAVNETLIEMLAKRPWHGNVRELRNAIEHAAVVARGRPLTIDDFPPPNPGREETTPQPHADLKSSIRNWFEEAIRDGESGIENEESPTDLHAQFLAAAEPTLFEMALQHTGGNRAKAAELLGIHRGTLRDRLRAYGIDGA